MEGWREVGGVVVGLEGVFPDFDGDERGTWAWVFGWCEWDGEGFPGIEEV